ncbi:MAG TPA: efflux RND transporter periplasmic adaptor subunit [Terriglobia bacterium]|nr:efflux RND transporter periplasmic adaptor subunit [Terriglobia bacterium]
MSQRIEAQFLTRTYSHSLLIALATGIVLLINSACASKGRGNDQPKTANLPTPVVVVAPVLQKTVPVYVEHVGRTAANYTVDIRPQVSGILESAPFAEGQPVKKGQVLFNIDPREYQAALESAQAQLAKAEADVVQARANLGKNAQDVARYAPLVKQQAIPQEQYDDAVAAEQMAQAQVEQAQAEVKAAEAAVNQARINLGYTVIRSPITGIIGRRQVDPGNLVSPNLSTPLVTVSSSNPIRVDFNVSETDYVRYIQRVKSPARREAAAARIAFDLLLPDGTVYPYKGKFYMIGRAVNAQTGTLLIEAQFPNPQDFLRPGQFCRVRFAAEMRPNAILTPQQAVMELQGAQTVLIVNRENKVELRTIATDGNYENFLIVSRGLESGERVIVEGQQKVRPGMTVTAELAASQPGI